MIEQIVEQTMVGLEVVGMALGLTLLIVVAVSGSMYLCPKVYEKSKVAGTGLALTLALIGVLVLSYFVGGA